MIMFTSSIFPKRVLIFCCRYTYTCFLDSSQTKRDEMLDRVSQHRVLNLTFVPTLPLLVDVPSDLHVPRGSVVPYDAGQDARLRPPQSFFPTKPLPP